MKDLQLLFLELKSTMDRQSTITKRLERLTKDVQQMCTELQAELICSPAGTRRSHRLGSRACSSPRPQGDFANSDRLAASVSPAEDQAAGSDLTIS